MKILEKLTTEQIGKLGAAMPEIMKFHEQLLGEKFKKGGRTKDGNPLVMFQSNVVLIGDHDDEGNPGSSTLLWLGLPEDSPVTYVGYCRLEGEDGLFPLVEFENGAAVSVMRSDCRPGVFEHQRPGHRKYDLFCQVHG